ncbi:hypothetical protein NLG97_g6625 [Lecanicillium saksenae]|uniref:Uncharacterized protein n=1 Tax=Lecanicillium saksenae TaxID=468837 RepID=A0ACC1QP49_9HYPO|nr:hypothetical protein NLG97_g6625 [Lecanicillium saksenae]
MKQLGLMGIVPVFGAGLSAATEANQDDAQSALTFAYQYGYPLAAYSRLFGQDSANGIKHWRELASADNHAVVRTNSDTLYSTVTYDLSHNDLSISLGELDDWYWLFSFYDPYGDNYANFGSAGKYEPGKYRLRHVNDSYGVFKSEKGDEFKGYVNSPTPHGGIVVRTAVYNRETDYPKVHAFQDTIRIDTLNRTFELGDIPALDASIFQYEKPSSKPISNATTVFALTAALAPWNLPLVHEDRARVNKTLLSAGIKDGKFIQPQGTNITNAQETASKAAAKVLATKPEYIQDLGNNWQQTGQLVTGNFSTLYDARQLIASKGYLQLTQDQALYPSYNQKSGDGTIVIGPDEAAVFTFSRVPFIKATGFWSLTAYENEYFIPNSLNRYVLNSGSNLTHPDGSLVREYGDQPFQIIVQSSDKNPGGNWTNNWLPGPRNGGAFAVNLRLYGAQPSMTDGGYVYPVVTIEKAIGSANSTTNSTSSPGTKQPPPPKSSAAALTASLYMIVACVAAHAVW